MKQTITPDHQRWLSSQLQVWQSENWIDAATANTIESSYDVVAGKRMSLAWLLLSVGGTFVGIGVIWLIAANLDELSPMVRLAAVFAFFAAALIGAETLAQRRTHKKGPLVHALRILASLLIGGVIFQAAQSLQVPAFDLSLLAYWSLGCFLYAYLMRGAAPMLVALPTGFAWALSAPMAGHESWLVFVTAMFASALLCTAIAQLPQPQRSFTHWWRETGAAAGLIALFIAAIPEADPDGFEIGAPLILLLTASAVATIAALLRSADRREPLMIAALAGLGVLLVFWEAGRNADDVDLASWAHAGLSVAVYVGAALWVAYLGIRHDSTRLTVIATAALVVFTTFQAFAVFGQIIQGAFLFLLLGLVLAGTGYFFDKARRELATTLEGADR